MELPKSLTTIVVSTLLLSAPNKAFADGEVVTCLNEVEYVQLEEAVLESMNCDVTNATGAYVSPAECIALQTAVLETKKFNAFKRSRRGTRVTKRIAAVPAQLQNVHDRFCAHSR